MVCETIYDEEKEGMKWKELPDNWACLVCESDKSYYKVVSEAGAGAIADTNGDTDEALRTSELEVHMADIHAISETGESITEPMRTRTPTFSWDEVLVMGAQLAKMPLNHDEPVNSRTVMP
jgi:rubredoxin